MYVNSEVYPVTSQAGREEKLEDNFMYLVIFVIVQILYVAFCCGFAGFLSLSDWVYQRTKNFSSKHSILCHKYLEHMNNIAKAILTLCCSKYTFASVYQIGIHNSLNATEQLNSQTRIENRLTLNSAVLVTIIILVLVLAVVILKHKQIIQRFFR